MVILFVHENGEMMRTFPLYISHSFCMSSSDIWTLCHYSNHKFIFTYSHCCNMSMTIHERTKLQDNVVEKYCVVVVVGTFFLSDKCKQI